MYLRKFLCFAWVLSCVNLQASIDLETFLREKLQEVERSDPPIFKLITNGGREVYVVGSIHNLSPEFILPPDAFAWLQALQARGAILITEHEPLYDYLLIELQSFGVTSEALWDPITKTSSWTAAKEIETSTWLAIQDTVFPGTVLKVDTITKTPFHLGALLLYSFASMQRRKTLPGFESTLQQWR